MQGAKNLSWDLPMFSFYEKPAVEGASDAIGCVGGWRVNSYPKLDFPLLFKGSLCSKAERVNSVVVTTPIQFSRPWTFVNVNINSGKSVYRLCLPAPNVMCILALKSEIVPLGGKKKKRSCGNAFLQCFINVCW